MNTVTLEMKLPEDVYLALQSSGLSSDDLRKRVVRDLAVQLYGEGRLSLGKAASMAGKDRLSFWSLLIERGFPVIDYTEDDYESDRAALRRFLEKEAGKP